jgi:hypothetical protein
MTIAIEDQQLEMELLELYLTGKQWLSDSDFMEDEVIFLRGLVYDLPNSGQSLFLPRLAEIKAENEMLRTRTVALMHRLEPVIVKKTRRLDRSLIDNFVNLQQAAAHALEELKLVKFCIVQARRGPTNNLPS